MLYLVGEIAFAGYRWQPENTTQNVVKHLISRQRQRQQYCVHVVQPERLCAYSKELLTLSAFMIRHLAV